MKKTGLFLGSVLIGSVSAHETYAHAFGTRYDLPLPLSLYLAAAGFTVAASFLGAVLFVSPTQQSWTQLKITLPIRLNNFFRFSLAIFGVLLFGMVIISAMIGPVSPTKNFATVFIWIFWWVGFLLFTSLIINLWPTVNPFNTLAKVLFPNVLSSRVVPGILIWGVPLGLLSISWLELVSDLSEQPGAVLAILILYTLGSLAGYRFYGQIWFDKYDPFSTLFQMLGHMAVFSWDRGRSVFHLRIPAFSLIDVRVRHTAHELLVLILISVVMFDGILETPFWASILEFITQSKDLRPLLIELKEGGVDILKGVETLSLLTLIGGSWFVFRSLCCCMRWMIGGETSGVEIAHVFVTSLLPIAIAYHLAHYISYLMFAGQLMVPIISDPFALGWDLFGTGAYRIDIGVINAENVWWVAITSVILGHVVSVLIAHTQAVRFFKNSKQAMLSQLPMALFMILLTMGSLWILSQPIIQ